jgi:hypothetical protein
MVSIPLFPGIPLFGAPEIAEGIVKAAALRYSGGHFTVVLKNLRLLLVGDLFDIGAVELGQVTQDVLTAEAAVAAAGNPVRLDDALVAPAPRRVDMNV